MPPALCLGVTVTVTVTVSVSVSVSVAWSWRLTAERRFLNAIREGDLAYVPLLSRQRAAVVTRPVNGSLLLGNASPPSNRG